MTVVINMLFLVDFICKLQNIELGKNYTHQCIYCYVSWYLVTQHIGLVLHTVRIVISRSGLIFVYFRGQLKPTWNFNLLLTWTHMLGTVLQLAAWLTRWRIMALLKYFKPTSEVNSCQKHQATILEEKEPTSFV